MPDRIQRKRTRGWRMPDNTVYVGRTTKWGNPFAVVLSGQAWCVVRCGEVLTHHDTGYIADRHAVNCYRDTLKEMTPEKLEEFLSPLRGKNLACWCKIGETCHADVLLELANRHEV